MKTHHAAAIAAVLAAAGAAEAQLRVCTWNITNYQSGRTAAFETAIYDTFNGQQLAPDIIFTQEMIGGASLTNFVDILNNAPGSPGDWDHAPYVASTNTERAFFYRTSKVIWNNTTVVATGNGSENPRHIMRYEFIPVGYGGAESQVSVYNLHMKAGSTPTDQNRRFIEADRVRNNANTLPTGRNIIVLGDFNIQRSTQAAYIELLGSQANNRGRVWDPILTPGNWNNNSTYRFVHSQDPDGGGGMDDRLDQILISEELFDGAGLEYLGSALTRFSNTTWNDPNHSYRTFGNDGTSFNQALRVNGNSYVGPTIAQALIDTCGGASGHLPVYCEFKVPPVLGINSVFVDIGDVEINTSANADFQVWNDGDTALWTTAGISDLNYSFTALSGDIVPPAGSFSAAAGDAPTTQSILVNAPASTGAFSAQLRLDSDTLGIGQESGQLTLFIVGNAVEPSCQPDITTTNTNPGDASYGQPDGTVDGADLAYYVEQWLGSNPVADFTTTNTNPGDAGYGQPDGAIDGADLAYYVEIWLANCL